MMRAGRVVRIRINPKDCLSVADIVDKAQIYTNGMSFSQVVSLALSSMLEAYRQGALIPVRDGFEYTKMMARFGDNPKVDRGRKLAITQAIQMAGSEAVTPIPVVSVTAGAQTVAQRRAEIRLRELAMRKEAEPLNWSEEDEAEFLRVIAVASGEPPASNTGGTG